MSPKKEEYRVWGGLDFKVVAESPKEAGKKFLDALKSHIENGTLEIGVKDTLDGSVHLLNMSDVS